MPARHDRSGETGPSFPVSSHVSGTRFVKALLRAEFARPDGTRDLVVAERVTTRLHQGLSDFIGPNGFDVLLARSIALTRRAHPFLNGVSLGPGGTLLGFDAAAPDGAEPQEAAMAMVHRFIELLVLLTGEGLALRLLRDVWPTLRDHEDDRPLNSEAASATPSSATPSSAT